MLKYAEVCTGGASNLWKLPFYEHISMRVSVRVCVCVCVLAYLHLRSDEGVRVGIGHSFGVCLMANVSPMNACGTKDDPRTLAGAFMCCVLCGR